MNWVRLRAAAGRSPQDVAALQPLHPAGVWRRIPCVATRQTTSHGDPPRTRGRSGYAGPVAAYRVPGGSSARAQCRQVVGCCATISSGFRTLRGIPAWSGWPPGLRLSRGCYGTLGGSDDCGLDAVCFRRCSSSWMRMRSVLIRIYTLGGIARKSTSGTPSV